MTLKLTKPKIKRNNDNSNDEKQNNGKFTKAKRRLEKIKQNKQLLKNYL